MQKKGHKDVKIKGEYFTLFLQRGFVLIEERALIEGVRYVLTLSSYPAIANPFEAAEPARPMKCSDPILDANRDAPTYRNLEISNNPIISTGMKVKFFIHIGQNLQTDSVRRCPYYFGKYFHLLRDERKGRECVCYVKGEKGEGDF